MLRFAATFVFGCAACLSSGCQTHEVASGDVSVQIDNPRLFGYVVGDMLERRIDVIAPGGVVLDERSLPRAGRQNAWLTLISADVGPLEREHGYIIRLRYQIRNAPTVTRTIDLPALDLRFAAGAHPVETSIQPAAVLVTPILPAGVPVEAITLRPDYAPKLIPTDPVGRRAVLELTLAAVIGMGLLASHLLRPSTAPFAKAYRVLRRLARNRPPDAYPTALRALHRALDATAGWPVFASRIDDFLARHPHFTPQRAALAAFLQISQKEFYAGEPSERAQPLEWLIGFCRDCRMAERRRK